MAKKRKPTGMPNRPQETEEKPASTLRDLLSRDVVDKLKAQADEMKAQEQKKREEERVKAAEARKAEQKRLDNDFEYLLNNSKMDWKQHKK